MLFYKIIALILSLLTNLNITYNKIEGASTGYYTIYKNGGECVADDYQLERIIEEFIINK